MGIVCQENNNTIYGRKSVIINGRIKFKRYFSAFFKKKRESKLKGPTKFHPPEAGTSVKNAVGLKMVIGFQMDEKQ